MLYCKHKKYERNITHNPWFHAERQRVSSAFCLPGNPNYWKLSVKKTPNHGTSGGSSGGEGNECINIDDQHTPAISELV